MPTIRSAEESDLDPVWRIFPKVAAGFLAMQFNIVVSTNEAAVGLWKKLGFAVVRTPPGAFRHAGRGLLDAFVMHRFL